MPKAVLLSPCTYTPEETPLKPPRRREGARDGGEHVPRRDNSVPLSQTLFTDKSFGAHAKHMHMCVHINLHTDARV